MLTTAVASTDTTNTGYLRACLQQTGLVTSVVEWTITNRAEWHLGPWESIPDVVLLDLPREMDTYFAFATHLRQLRPTVRIIACAPTQHPDPDLLLQAMRSGVQEFLPKPINVTALADTLARFMQERGASQTRASEKPIIVMGSKGGVGTSTVALNLGVQLVQVTKKRVALLDFARPLGHLSLLLDLQPRFFLRDAIENLDRLDGHFLGGLLVRHKTGLEILAGTTHPEEWDQIPLGGAVRVVNVAQSTFDYVLIDFGSGYVSEWNSILRLARMILIVAEANVPSLWSLQRHISAATALGLDPDRIRIVINRWNRNDDEALKTLEKNMKRPIFARLPNNYKHVSEAFNLGVPLTRNSNNPLMAKFKQLASQLAGVGLAEGDKRSTFINMFTFPLLK